ncbi:SUMO1 sentrin specific peptidase 1, partial [Coemansia sp. RSA 475]
MAASGTKRAWGEESAEIPGSFPRHNKALKRRLDSWTVQSKPAGSSEGLVSLFMSPIRLAANWLIGNNTPISTKSFANPPTSTPRSSGKPHGSARRKRTKDRVRKANEKYEREQHGRQQRRRQGVARKSLLGGLGSSKSRNLSLVHEYTTPSVWNSGASARRDSLGALSTTTSMSLYGATPTRKYTGADDRGDTQSILSVDSSLHYRRSSSALTSRLATPTKPAATSTTDLWFARLRKKIEDTLLVSSPAPHISTPAYDRLVREEAGFDARIAKARSDMAFTLPADAPKVIAQAESAGFTAELNNVPVTARDILTLGDGKWLNDEVINFYMQLIIDRSRQMPALPKIHAFNTFFFSTLSDNGYARVRRWTRRIKLFEHDMVIVPVHLGVHWCCAVIDFRAKSIVYYDALLGDNPKCLRLLLNYLHEESKDKCGADFDESG